MSGDGMIRRAELEHSRYAEEEIDGELGKRLEALRGRRARSEYGSVFYGPSEVEDAIEIAARLVEICGQDV